MLCKRVNCFRLEEMDCELNNLLPVVDPGCRWEKWERRLSNFWKETHELRRIGEGTGGGGNG